MSTVSTSLKKGNFTTKCCELFRCIDEISNRLERISDADTLPYSLRECEELYQALYAAQVHIGAAELVLDKEVTKWGL